VGGHLWGVVLASSFGDRPLPEPTAARLSDFTDLVTTAISNAQARTEVARLADEQAALRRVATLVAQGADLDAVCNAVTAETGRLHEADAAGMIRYEGSGEMSAVATWPATGEHPPVMGPRWELDGGGLASRIARTGLPDRIDDWRSEEGDMARHVREVLGFRASVATPISVDGRLWGAVMVHSRREGWTFPPGSESRLGNFADLVTTAISNVQARDEVRRLADEQAALRRVATLVAQQPSPEELFELVAREVEQLMGVEDARLLRYEPDGTATVVATSGRLEQLQPAGARVNMDSPTVGALVLRTGKPARVDDYEEMDGELAAQIRSMGIRSAAGAPISVDGRLWGCVLATSIDAQPLPEQTAARLMDVTELVATAIANIEARAAVAASRARIVAATDEARRRFERDLHDGAQQRLVSLALELRGVEAMTPPELADVRAEIARVGDGVTGVLDDLRELSRGLHPAILAEGGLAPALRALARRSAVPVRLDAAVAGRLEHGVEVAAYYVVSEALANASKHAGASKVTIALAKQGGELVLSVADDGVGGADPARGSGLLGIIDRVEALGGSLALHSPQGGGTEVRGRLPLAGRPPG
jgi:signal transduction histidine kinase